MKRYLPRAHIEPARSESALAKYVVKEDTRLAEISQSVVSTPRMIQDSLLKYVLERLASGDPRENVFRQYYKESRIDTKSRKVETYWAHRTVSYTENNSDIEDSIQIIKANYQWILENAADIVDSVVRSMIRNRVYQVEFIMSNNQVSTAYKRYLPDILIRNCYASQTQLSQETSTTPPSHEENHAPPEVD